MDVMSKINKFLNIIYTINTVLYLSHIVIPVIPEIHNHYRTMED